MASEAAGEDTLAPLRADLDPEVFHEIVSLYHSTMKDRAGALEAAAHKGDLGGVRRNAHDLAGMCGQIGAAHAQTLARRIEIACVNGKSGDALALVPELMPAVAAALADLARHDR